MTIEEAEAYRLLIQKLDLTQERLGERLGKAVLILPIRCAYYNYHNRYRKKSKMV